MRKAKCRASLMTFFSRSKRTSRRWSPAVQPTVDAVGADDACCPYGLARQPLKMIRVERLVGTAFDLEAHELHASVKKPPLLLLTLLTDHIRRIRATIWTADRSSYKPDARAKEFVLLRSRVRLVSGFELCSSCLMAFKAIASPSARRPAARRRTADVALRGRRDCAPRYAGLARRCRQSCAPSRAGCGRN